MCVFVFLWEKGSREQLQLFLIGFYRLSLENRNTHTVIIALLPFSRYFATFAPPWPSHNKENDRTKRQKKERETDRGRGAGGEKKRTKTDL